MSRTPEGKVKAHLIARVKALGGTVRFVKFIGRRGCPDTRVMFGSFIVCNPERMPSLRNRHNCWVETKAGKDGRLSIGQQREINRMRDMGETVYVLTTIEEIDNQFPAP